MIQALIIGIAFGGIMKFFNLPIPAPNQIEGIIAIVGLFIGYKMI